MLPLKEPPLSPDKLNTLRLYFSERGTGRRYAVGRNDDVLGLAARWGLTAIVDDFYPAPEWRTIPVIKSADLPPDALVVNGSTSISPVAVDRLLQNLEGKIAGHFALGDACRAPGQPVTFPAFMGETRADFEANRDRWESLYSRLGDAESRRTLEDVLSFRLWGAVEGMAGYTIRLQDQYFDPCLALTREESFVDGGGFDGDTTEQLHRRAGGLKASYFLEPSAENMEKARTRLAGIDGVVYLPFGLSDRRTQLRFDSGAGSASRISAHGANVIEVAPLDELVSGKITFLKLDVEGAELAALRGAAKHIVNDHPKMAIAVYHRAPDFWQVPAYIDTLSEDYRLFLRHYTQGWSETILYFAPR
jgi:FkbM family methyltransferase